MELFDTVHVTDFVLTDEGFLVANARLSRSGVQVYRVGEPSLGGHFADMGAGKVIRVHRPESEVFSAESIDSLRGKPLTIDHEDGFVTADNAEKVVVGFIGDAIERDGDHLVGRVRVTHARGIKAVENGKLELSVGYSAEIVEEPGTTPRGETFDGFQKTIRANHVSLVARGRCGGSCRVQDADDSSGKPNHRSPNQMAEKTNVIDCAGTQIEVSDAAAIAIRNMVEKHDAAIEAKDSEIATLTSKVSDGDKATATLEAKLEDAESKLAEAEKLITPEALDAAAQERSALVEAAHAIAPDLDCSTLDAEGIKRGALKAIEVDTEGRSSDWLDAAFDIRAEQAGEAKKSTARRVGESLAKGGKQTKTTDAEGDPRTAYLTRTTGAHLGGSN